MRYSLVFLLLFLFNCQDESVTPIDPESILGNWLVIQELDKATQTTRSQDGGLITTWNGASYIGAIKIMDSGTVKVNKYDGSYLSTDIEGTWTIDKSKNVITFKLQSFTKEFSIRKENDLLIFDSPSLTLWHKLIP